MSGLAPSAALPLGDPVPLVDWWLSNHAALTDAFGGTPHVGMWNEPPYPAIVVSETGAGSDGALLWQSAPEIQLEVFGDLDGNPGKAALRRLLYTALGALTELAMAPWPYGDDCPAGAPVVSWVASSRAGGYVPLATGQPRFVAAVRLYVRPGI